MLVETLAAVLSMTLMVSGQSGGICKDPLVEKRLLADDVRYASPFYVIALPRNARTQQMDNVCYTYFENGNTFFHVMSITFKNGSNTYHTYSKSDISDRMGLAEATALAGSQCTYHDYTLTPICNVSVFILYRCFIEGSCGNIDIGITPGVDVRVVLAATPKINAECRRETEMSLKDTSVFNGGNYVILPQTLKPQCITKYNNINSIGHDRAQGSKVVTESDISDRFGSEGFVFGAAPPASTPVKPASWSNQNGYPAQRPPVKQPPPASFNPYGTSVKETTQTRPQNNGRPGYVPAPAWTKDNGQWNAGSAPWGQQAQPGVENHFHIWQSPSGTTKTTPAKNPNVYYHIHSWENPPPGCCKCT